MGKANEKYPYGKLNKQDEGELTIAVHIEGNAVRVDFGKPVAWLGLAPVHARALAQSLLEHAARIEQARQ